MRSDWNAEGVAEPRDGDVRFGVEAWDPSKDLSFARQQTDPRKPHHGLWRLGTPRCKGLRRCPYCRNVGGHDDGRLRRLVGYRATCAWCSSFAQDHLLPPVVPIRSMPEISEATAALAAPAAKGKGPLLGGLSGGRGRDRRERTRERLRRAARSA